jgi:hypothetical protein
VRHAQKIGPASDDVWRFSDMVEDAFFWDRSDVAGDFAEVLLRRLGQAVFHVARPSPLAGASAVCARGLVRQLGGV